jgi:hemerythrin
MALLTWKADYSVRVPSIDAQHQKLVELVNTLHEAMTSGQGKTVLATVLGELAVYTRTHFAHEEGLMARAFYPGLAAHRAQHQSLIARLAELESRADAGASVTIETMTFLRTWLIQHIQQEDMAYSACLQEKGVR